MGGPIDARRSPTAIDRLATCHSLAWFQHNLIHPVPEQYPGAGRKVYPGFLQHAGLVAAHPDRLVVRHWDYYVDLLRGDVDSARGRISAIAMCITPCPERTVSGLFRMIIM
jgi:poly(3-hydroxybutyrate) depolymerase